MASIGGQFLVPLSADNRAAARFSAGDEVDVDIEPDDQLRGVAVPADLAAALLLDAEAQAFFDQLAFTHRKEWVRWVEEAKKAETRTARIVKTVASLHAGPHALNGCLRIDPYPLRMATGTANVLLAALRRTARAPARQLR